METRQPPHLNDYPSLAEWKRARALYFKALPRRDWTQQVIETVKTEMVEVERIVYVDREVEVVREIEAAPVEVQIPEFLRYDPLAEFVQTEQREGETDTQTLQRLRDELLDLLTLERGDGLTPTEEVRKRHLSANIQPTGD